MRIFLEVLVAAGLIAAAWQTPYREHAGRVIPSLASKPETKPNASYDEEPRIVANPQPHTGAVAADLAAPAPVAPASPAAKNDWMWDSKRPGSLDRPGQTATPTAFTKHIYYTDEKGKKYWLDAEGRRHYD